MKKLINIALCMNSIEESKTLGIQLLGLDFEAKVHVCRSLPELVECISEHQINCFVFEYNCEKFQTTDLAKKLRKIPKYSSSSFIFVSDEDKMSEVYEDPDLKVDLVITRPFIKQDYATHLNEIWKRQLCRIIPENLRVLIIDDNPGIIEVLEMQMERLQHKNFDTCRSVEEAINLFSKQDYDLLIVDWDLEDGTCMEIIDKARSGVSSKRLNEALTVVMTGRNAVEDIMTLIAKDVKDHIIKPFDQYEFEDKIYYALERHQKRMGSY